MGLEVFSSFAGSGREVRAQRASWRVGFRVVLLSFSAQPADPRPRALSPGRFGAGAFFWEPGVCVWVMTAAGNYSGGIGNPKPALTKTVWPEQRPRRPPAASAQPRSSGGFQKDKKRSCSFNFLPGKSQNQQCKTRHMAGKKKSLCKASPPRRKAGIVDIFLRVPAADLGDPDQEPNSQMPPALFHMCPSLGSTRAFFRAAFGMTEPGKSRSWWGSGRSCREAHGDQGQVIPGVLQRCCCCP